MLGWPHIASGVCQNLCFAYSLPALVGYTDDSEQILDICSALAAECQISQLEEAENVHFFLSSQLPMYGKCILKESCVSSRSELL